MNNLKYILTILFLSITIFVQAQKFGHINSQELLISMPAIKSADSQLQAFQKSLEDKFMAEGKTFETEYVEFTKRANSGEYPAAQLQKEQEALSVKQQKLQTLQSESQQKILMKREELYAPILKRVEDAVKAVGKENGYTMIFDSSTGSILHGQDSLDVSALVKKKLGI